MRTTEKSIFELVGKPSVNIFLKTELKVVPSNYFKLCK